jgi:hypothetical protein
MGYSYDFDDGPVMCFNGPKSFQLGWYNDHHITLSADNNFSWTGKLYGVAGYKKAADSDAVIIKLDDQYAEYYVSYNRQEGINSGTMEGKNKVLVHKQSSYDAAPSILLEMISESSSFTTDTGIVINFVSASNSYAIIEIGTDINPVTPSPTSLTLSPTSSPQLNCVDQNGKFVYKVVKENGIEKARLKNCKWLLGKNAEKRSNICSKKTVYFEKNGNILPPAQVRCASTCGDTCHPCFENANTYYSHDDGDYRTCSYLKRNPAKIDKICSRTASYEGYPIPSVACPITCKMDQCAQSSQELF